MVVVNEKAPLAGVRAQYQCTRPNDFEESNIKLWVKAEIPGWRLKAQREIQVDCRQTAMI